MKKFICYALVLIFVCFAFTACESNTQMQEEEVTQTSPELCEEVEKAREFVRQQTGAEIELRGNSVVYVFTVDESKEDCEIAANAVEDVVLEALEQARKDLPEIESFVYEYRKSDGSTIYKKEYSLIG